MKPSFNQALNHRIIGLTNQAEPNFITMCTGLIKNQNKFNKRTIERSEGTRLYIFKHEGLSYSNV